MTEKNIYSTENSELDDLCLKEFTEHELISVIQKTIKGTPNKSSKPNETSGLTRNITSELELSVGDDAAIFTNRNKTVVTTDILVENYHFKLNWSTGFDIGVRSISQNVADTAAMGATPTYAVIALGFNPNETTFGFYKDFVRGVTYACKKYNISLIGGDLSASDKLIVSVCAFGEISKNAFTRDNAQAGDTLYYFGNLGYGMFGFEILKNAEESRRMAKCAGECRDNRSLDENDLSDFARQYRKQPCEQTKGKFKPQNPKIAELLEKSPVFGKAIKDYLQTDSPVNEFLNFVKSHGDEINACMDLSDGLLVDTNRIARKSNKHIQIDFETLKDENLMHALRVFEPEENNIKPLFAKLVLMGGEEHGFIFTSKNENLKDAHLRKIGKVFEDGDPSAEVVNCDENISGLSGYSHVKKEFEL